MTAVMAFGAIIAVFVLFYRNTGHEAFTCFKFNNNWRIEDGTKVDIEEMKFKPTGHIPNYMLKKRLPDMLIDNQELMFMSQHVKFTVYLNDTEIYRYNPVVPTVAGKSTGLKVHLINLGEDSNSKTLTIMIDPIYDDDSGRLTNVCIGNSGAYISDSVRRNVGGAIMAFFVIFLSLLVLILSRGLPKDNRQRNSMIYLSFLGITGAIWVLFESAVFPLVVREGVMSENLEIFMIVFSALASVAFLYDFYHIKNPTVLRLMVLINFVLVTVMVVSTFAGYKDYHEMLKVVQGVAVFEALVDVEMIIRYSFSEKYKARRKVLLPIALGFCLVVISMFYAVFKYAVLGNTSPNSAKIMGFALMVLMLFMLIHYNYEITNNTKKAIKAEAFEKMAYTDELTGIDNRAAYYRTEMSLKEEVEAGSLAGIMIINMDLNNLKMVNDLYGHDYGDRYLTSAAEVMRRTFSEVGSIFRTGGDEFIVLVPLKYDSEEDLKSNEQNITENLKSNEILIGRRDGWETELSIAYGVAYFFGEEDIETARKRADKEMYKMKSRMKAGR